MKKPEVGDLVVGWNEESYSYGWIGVLMNIDLDPARPPFELRLSHKPNHSVWRRYVQTITPDQVKDVINGVWKPVEEPKPGDLVVAWDWKFDTDTSIRIGILKDFRNSEETRYPYRVSYSQERMDSEGFEHVQKISPEEIPGIFKEGWKPRGY